MNEWLNNCIEWVGKWIKEEWMNEWRMNKRMNEWTNARRNENERFKLWTKERMKEWTNEPMNDLLILAYECTNVRMAEWMNEWKKVSIYMHEYTAC